MRHRHLLAIVIVGIFALCSHGWADPASDHGRNEGGQDKTEKPVVVAPVISTGQTSGGNSTVKKESPPQDSPANTPGSRATSTPSPNADAVRKAAADKLAADKAAAAKIKADAERKTAEQAAKNAAAKKAAADKLAADRETARKATEQKAIADKAAADAKIAAGRGTPAATVQQGTVERPAAAKPVATPEPATGRPTVAPATEIRQPVAARPAATPEPATGRPTVAPAAEIRQPVAARSPVTRPTAIEPARPATATRGTEATITAPAITLTARKSDTPVYVAPTLTAKTNEPVTYTAAEKPRTVTPTAEGQQAERERLSKRLVEQFTQVTDPKPRNVDTQSRDRSAGKAAETVTDKPRKPEEPARPVITTGLLDCSNPRFVEDNPELCRKNAKTQDSDVRGVQPAEKKTSIMARTDTTQVNRKDDSEFRDKRSDVDNRLAAAACSNPTFTRENPGKCPIQPVRDAACAGHKPSSAVFDVTKVKSTIIPYKPDQIGNPLLLDSAADPIQQYILIPISEGEDATAQKILVMDPKTGLAHIFGLPDKGRDMVVVKDSNDTGSILLMATPKGIMYLSDASTAVEKTMKDSAVPTDQVVSITQVELDPSAFKFVPIPSDEKALSVYSTDAGIVIVTANSDGTLKGFWYFAALSDATGKFVPAPPDASGHTVRKAIIVADHGKLVADIVLMPNTVIHSADLLNSAFAKLEDAASASKDLEKANAKNLVNGSEKASAKKKNKDKKKDSGDGNDNENEKFKGLLAESAASGKLKPVVTHGFMDFGDKLSTLVIQENGLSLAKEDNGVISPMEGELLTASDGAACNGIIDALPVDVGIAGGKGLALIVNTGDGLALTTYPNINQPPQIVTITATSAMGSIPLGVETRTEQGENVTCHWEAYQVKPDGKDVNVSSQLTDADSCNPTFNLGETPPKTSLLDQPSILNIAADWLEAQISIRSAYAGEIMATTTTTYRFVATVRDPLGLESTAQVTTQVTAPITDAGSSPLSFDPPVIKVVSAEMLTPTQKDDIKVASAATQPVTPSNVGSSAGVGGQAVMPPTDKTVEAGPAGIGGGGEQAVAGAWATEGGCSLNRNTTPLPPLGWLWLLPLPVFIPARAICCQRSPRRPNRCQSARGLRR